MKRTKAEKRARKAQFAARKAVEAHDAIEARAVAVFDSMQKEVETLRMAQENFRGLIFGAFLGRALGEEPTLSEAMLKSRPELFKGYENAPWLAWSESGR